MQAIISSRVSTAEQKEAGNSLPAQTERMRQYCIRKGFEVAKIFSFDESAYKTNRAEFDKILDYIESQTEKLAVVFDKVDRFSRNVFDRRISTLYDLAMKDDVELHFVSDNLVINSKISATEKFHFSTNLGLAKYYSDAISDNVKRAYENLIKNGEYTGYAPLGYLNINTENQTLAGKMTPYKKEVQRIFLEKQMKENYTFKRIEVDPVKGPMLKSIFEDAATGRYSLSMLQDRMDEMGLMGKLGKHVSKNSLMGILKNPFYCGLMKHNGEIFPGGHQPLITRPLFDLVQIKIKERTKPIKTRWQFHFTGIARCHTCKCSITAEKKTKRQQNGNVHHYTYYHCTGMRDRVMKRPCLEQAVEEKVLRKQLAKQVKKLQLNDMVRELLVVAIKNGHEKEKELHAGGIQEWQNMYKVAEDKLNKLFELFYSGLISQEDFAERKKSIMDEKQKAREHLDTHGDAQKSWLNYSEKLVITTNHVYEIFNKGTPEEVKALLLAIGKNYVLKDGKISFQFKAPYNYVVQLNMGGGSNKTELQGRWESNPDQGFWRPL